MKYSIEILGIGQCVPKEIYTNKDVEQITPNSNAHWISSKLGINSRRLVNKDNVVSLGAKSAYDAIKDSRLAISDIDLIIVNTSSSDNLSPSVACMIQHKLQANCPAFDINAVCSGFIYALDLASELLNKYKNILIISTETYSKITDWNDKNSCFFGDGSASIIITKHNEPNFISYIGADGTGFKNFICSRKSTFEMNGKEVYNFGITILPKIIEDILNKNNFNISDIDYLVPHQPSHNVLKKTAEILKLDENKVCFNMSEYANTAGASVPMALYKLIKENKIKNNNLLVLAAIGSGWTYGVGLLKLKYK